MIATFFRKLALLLVPMALVVAGVNYFVDPANLFSPDAYVSGIAEVLSKGHNVDNVTNYDERKLQEQVVKRMRTTPQLVVLGSSRIMEIGKELLPGRDVVNCGVSHAQIRDVVAITGLLDSMQRMPQAVMLNVDAGLVSVNRTDEWKSLAVYLERYVRKNPRLAGALSSREPIKVPRKLTSLFSLDYFQSGLSFLSRKRNKTFQDVGERTPEGSGRFSDGTVAYAYEYRNIKPLKVNMEAWTAARNLPPGQPDPEQQRLFEGLLDVLRDAHVEVSLCMLPYHPVYYHVTDSVSNGAMKAYESYYKDQAAKRGLRISGSLDPAQVGAGTRDFYDAQHSPKPSIKRFLDLR